jgi:YD repeat-containing protein
MSRGWRFIVMLGFSVFLSFTPPVHASFQAFQTNPGVCSVAPCFVYGMGEGLFSTREEACLDYVSRRPPYIAGAHVEGSYCVVQFNGTGNPTYFGIAAYAIAPADPIYVCPDDKSELSGTNCTCKEKEGFIQVGTQNFCSKLKELDATQPPEPPKACKVPGNSRPKFGNPIYPLTGSKVEPVATGIEIGGLALSLTYDNASRAPGSISSSYNHLPSFGELWFTNLHRKLNISPTLQTAILSRGDGRLLSFIGNGSGLFTVAANRNETLVSLAGGGYRFIDIAGGIQELYNAAGQLTSLSTSQGQTLSFTYVAGDLTAIQDSAGKVLQFSYASAANGDGRITQITDPTGRTISAAYDSAGNLASLTWQDSKIRQFLYENTSFPWALTGVKDENNNRYATFGYDSQGRAISTEYSGGVNRYSVTYGQAPTVSVVDSYDAAINVLSRTRSWQMPASPVLTTPNGSTSDMGVQNQFGMPALTTMSQPAGSGCAAATSSMAYDANGNVASKDDFSQKRSCYAYDSKNQPTTTVDGLANTVDCASVIPANASLPAGSRKTSTQYHPDWSLPTKTARPLSLTTSIYNGQPDPFNGNAVASCAPATAKTPDNKPIAMVCKQVEQATTDIDGSQGLAATLDTNLAQRTSSFTYDAQGRMLTSIDPLNRTTTYAYYTDTGFQGPAPESFDPNLASVSLLLHADGANGGTSFTDNSLSPKTITRGGSAITSATQSRFGGSSLYFDGVRDYISLPADPSFALKSSDFTIEMWIYKLGNNSNTSRLWNPEGDLYADANLGIDANGKLVSYGSSTGTSWNAWAFATGIAIPDGVWKHVALVRAGGTVTLYVDGMGTALTTTLGTTSLFDGGYTHVVGGQGTGADRAFNGYVDDVRITKGVARYSANFTSPSQAFPNTSLAVLDPNAIGHTVGDLQSVTNAVGHITQFTQYDRAGRVRQMIDPKGVVTDTVYAPRGWISGTTVTPPGGVARTTTYNYDNAGQLTGVVMPDATTLAYSYDAAHRLVGVTDAKGNTITYTLDNMGNRVGEQVKDPQGNLQRNITRVYDALNRIQQVTGASN